MQARNQFNFEKIVEILNSKGYGSSAMAFDYLKVNSKKLVYYIVIKNGGNQQEAEDILNDTVTDVFQKILNNEYDPEKSSIVTFVTSVANNKWLYYYRGKKNRTVRERYYLAKIKNEIPDETRKEQRKIMIDALLSLDEPCYSILKGFYLNGKKLKDIAIDLDISESAVKQRRKRCVEKLKLIISNFLKP